MNRIGRETSNWFIRMHLMPVSLRTCLIVCNIRWSPSSFDISSCHLHEDLILIETCKGFPSPTCIAVLPSSSHLLPQHHPCFSPSTDHFTLLLRRPTPRRPTSTILPWHLASAYTSSTPQPDQKTTHYATYLIWPRPWRRPLLPPQT